MLSINLFMISSGNFGFSYLFDFFLKLYFSPIFPMKHKMVSILCQHIVTWSNSLECLEWKCCWWGHIGTILTVTKFVCVVVSFVILLCGFFWGGICYFCFPLGLCSCSWSKVLHIFQHGPGFLMVFLWCCTQPCSSHYPLHTQHQYYIISPKQSSIIFHCVLWCPTTLSFNLLWFRP